MVNSIEFYGDGFGRDVISADSPKIEGIEGNRLLRVVEMRRFRIFGYFCQIFSSHGADFPFPMRVTPRKVNSS